MTTLISLLITIIIFGLIWYCIGLIPLPEPFGTIARVILVIIAIIYLLQYLPAGHI